MNKPDNNSKPLSGLHRALREAMLDLGWIPPTTEQEFAEFEAQLRTSAAELPSELAEIADPLEAPRFSEGATPDTIPFPQTEVQQNLARAARGGGQISPDVLERMRRDRSDSEGNVNGG